MKTNHDTSPRKAIKRQWWVYMLACADDTFYTGITTDVQRRLNEHNGPQKGARYTRARQPVRLLMALPVGDRGAASRLEYRIKRLDRRAKQQLWSDLAYDPPLNAWVRQFATAKPD